MNNTSNYQNYQIDSLPIPWTICHEVNSPFKNRYELLTLGNTSLAVQDDVTNENVS